MKKVYIIATASGWYWRAYNVKEDEFNERPTYFGNKESCEPYLAAALNCRNVGGDITIMEIYTKEELRWYTNQTEPKTP